MLALSTAVDVASGSMVLGKYETEPGSVLYYALDDPRRRFRDRLRRMIGRDRSDEALKRLSIKYTAPRIDQGFLQDLEKHLIEHDVTKLVVIDMLSRIRPPTRVRGNFYQAENDFMSDIRELVPRYHVCCLLLHHIRKAEADDIFDTLIGTTGLIGATDGAYILKAERGENTAVLYGMGNDIEDIQLGLSFDPEHFEWSIEGTEEDVSLTRTRKAAYDYLKRSDDPQNIGQVAQAIGVKYDTAKHALQRLKDNKNIHQDGMSRFYFQFTVPIVPTVPTVPTVPWPFGDTFFPTVPIDAQNCPHVSEPQVVENESDCIEPGEAGDNGDSGDTFVQQKMESALAAQPKPDEPPPGVTNGVVRQDTSTTCNDAPQGVDVVQVIYGTEFSPSANLNVATLECLHPNPVWDDDAGVSVCANCGECVDDKMSLAKPACHVCGVTSGDCSHMRKQNGQV
jgi:hypothetical protein